ncbi:hypothetical protein [Bradyrhizobium sp. SBR1B]|uniref:hypothetical protein n=1 Tax=Bradyrhizobium sp. SBR1B TaxID=2663836 RepID=UPI001605C631|nr:hypothetical protein [Bradyrhizobium sp. SBR1B]MBB4383589.1 hypothetical protein [Bradyrhizobium sp. SBR1B]
MLRKLGLAGCRATKRLQFTQTVLDDVTLRGEIFADWVLQQPMEIVENRGLRPFVGGSADDDGCGAEELIQLTPL